MDNNRVLLAAQVYAAKLKEAEDATLDHRNAALMLEQAFRVVEQANAEVNFAYQDVIDAIQGKERLPVEKSNVISFAPKLGSGPSLG